jgi:hypothetical protein
LVSVRMESHNILQLLKYSFLGFVAYEIRSSLFVFTDILKSLSLILSDASTTCSFILSANSQARNGGLQAVSSTFYIPSRASWFFD